MATEQKSPLEALLDLAVEEKLETEFVVPAFRNTDEEALRQIVASPYALAGISDAGAHLNQECGTEYPTYMLSHWVREQRALRLEEAVRRLSYVTARVAGIRDRGLLREGYTADVVVFDPEKVKPGIRHTVRDLPNGEPRLVQLAEGVRYVAVAGQVILEDGHHTEVYPGRVLDGRDYWGSRDEGR
jgi:N-acyl-D-aspartate/D-glutamate deacylase